MRKIFLYLPVICFTACNSGTENNTVVKDTAVKQPAAENKIVLNNKRCFQNILQRDTSTIELFVNDTSGFGNLVYKRFEKDGNNGTFRGSLHNGIIKAEYTFTSEGTTSVREVMFRMQDNTLAEGHGEMNEVGSKMIFKDSAAVKFDQVYNSIECK